MRTGQRRTRQHGQDVAHRIVPDAQCRFELRRADLGVCRRRWYVCTVFESADSRGQWLFHRQEPRAGRIVLTLASSDGQVVASQIVDVKAMEFIRLLDVFAALNAPRAMWTTCARRSSRLFLWRVERPSCSLRPARSRTTRGSMPIFASPSSTSDASAGQFVTRPPPESCQSVSATRADRCRAPIHRSRRRQP